MAPGRSLLPSKLARFSLLAGGPIGLPLRASNEHILIVRVARAQETNGLPFLPSRLARSLPRGGWPGLVPNCARRTTTTINGPSKLARFSLLAGGPIGLLLRASNEALLRARVARAQETNGLPYSSIFFFLHPPTCEQHLLALR